MALEDTNVIDFVHIDDAGVMVLTLTDAWQWLEGEDEHLQLLEDKLNTYLRAIESGEAARELGRRTGLAFHPVARKRISVRSLYAPAGRGVSFYEYLRDLLAEIGTDFELQVGTEGRS